jgi:hypothetical protein
MLRAGVRAAQQLRVVQRVPQWVQVLLQVQGPVEGQPVLQVRPQAVQ